MSIRRGFAGTSSCVGPAFNTGAAGCEAGTLGSLMVFPSFRWNGTRTAFYRSTDALRFYGKSRKRCPPQFVSIWGRRAVSWLAPGNLARPREDQGWVITDRGQARSPCSGMAYLAGRTSRVPSTGLSVGGLTGLSVGGLTGLWVGGLTGLSVGGIPLPRGCVSGTCFGLLRRTGPKV